MKKHGYISWMCIGVMVLSLTSCKVRRPNEVLSDAKMEAVLYDYHIAKAMSDQLPAEERYKQVLFTESVYKKHGITEAEFDTSMVWFSRHPEVLRDIYQRVAERLEKEKDGIDNLIAKRNDRPKTSLAGDSVDIWVGSRVYRLTGMPLDNRILFSMPSDTSFYNRDTLRWTMRFRFEGDTKTGNAKHYLPVMGMQVTYEGDTSCYEVAQIQYPGIHTLSLWSDSLGKIKEVNCFVYYPMQRASSGHNLLIDQVSLMRYHAVGDSAYASSSLHSTLTPRRLRSNRHTTD